MEAILLEVALNAGLNDHQTTRQFYFALPEGIQAVIIELSYSPQSLPDGEKSREAIAAALRTAGEEPDDKRIQACQPLCNLITLSLDDPLGYRGCAHRKAAPMQIRLDEGSASPGFFARPLQTGEWRLSLHFHALLKDFVKVHCQVKGEKQ